MISKKYSIFTVADGVSRTRNKNGSYPKTSGARLAAEEFCKNTIDYLGKNFNKADLKTLRKTFNFANKAIFNLNEKYGINQKLDYLTNDYFCTWGVAAFIKRDILYRAPAWHQKIYFLYSLKLILLPLFYRKINVMAIFYGGLMK